MNLCKKRKIDTFHQADLTAIPSLKEIKILLECQSCPLCCVHINSRNLGRRDTGTGHWHEDHRMTGLGWSLDTRNVPESLHATRSWSLGGVFMTMGEISWSFKIRHKVNLNCVRHKTIRWCSHLPETHTTFMRLIVKLMADLTAR